MVKRNVKIKALVATPDRGRAGDITPWKPLDQRTSDREMKRLAVLHAATRLFLDRGMHQATMNELAERLNITKPALYNYFRNKDDIVTECFRLANKNTEAAFASAEAFKGNGLEKVRYFIREYVKVSTFAHGACMNRLDDRDLTESVRSEFRGLKRAIDQRARALLRAGIADGSIVRCDVRMTTFAIMGAIQWVSHWYRSDGDLTPEHIADEYAVRLTDGIAAAPRKKR